MLGNEHWWWLEGERNKRMSSIVTIGLETDPVNILGDNFGVHLS